MISKRLVLISLLVLGGCGAPLLIRHPLANSTFPIASDVEVQGDVATVYLAGQVPPNVVPTPGKHRPSVYGTDTRAQTEGTLRSIERTLNDVGLAMSDVIKMQLFLIGDPAKGGKMDFAGFMEGYTQFFGTAAQPNLPSRSVFQVVSLANAAWFVEIEVVAIRHP